MTQIELKKRLKSFPAEKRHKALNTMVAYGVGKSTAYQLLAGRYPYDIKPRLFANCEKAVKKLLNV